MHVKIIKVIDYSVGFDKICRNLGAYTKARFTHYPMEPIPKDILIQFDEILKQRNVPLSSHSDYRKWLRYFLDYRAKYSPPEAKTDQVRLFAEKLRSKNQTAKQLEEAADAVSLLFALQQRKGKEPGKQGAWETGLMPRTCFRPATTFARSRSSWVTPMSGQP